MRKLRLIFTSVLLCSPLLAGTPERVATNGSTIPRAKTKQAWQWTDDERIASRSDAAAAQTRVNEAIMRQGAPNARVQPNDVKRHGLRPFDVISGRLHPELFMPHEVFEEFIAAGWAADDDTGRAYRAAYARDAKAMNLPENFVSVAQKVSAAYISALRLERSTREKAANGDKAATSRVASAHASACRARAAALKELRGTFGRENVDRFLYGSVAPTMTSSWTSLLNPDALRREEGGCQ